MAEETTSTTPPDACHAAYTGAQCMYTQHPPQLVYREVLGHPAIQTDVSVPNACGFALQHAVPYPCDPGRQHAVLDPCGFALEHAVPYPCDPGRQHAVLDACGLGHPATNAGVLVPDFCGQQRIVMNFDTLGHPAANAGVPVPNFGTLGHPAANAGVPVPNLGGFGHGQYCPSVYQAGMQGVMLLQI